MFDADNFLYRFLERTSQMYFMSKDSSYICGLNREKTKGMLFSLDTVALNGCYRISMHGKGIISNEFTIETRVSRSNLSEIQVSK